MTREQAERILAEREGTPPEHLEHCRTEDLVAAALAPEGQPCCDCGTLVVWRDEGCWVHVQPTRRCFLNGGAVL